MVIHKLQFLFTKSTVTLYRQWEIEQKQPVQMADTKTNETRNREVNSLYYKSILSYFIYLYISVILHDFCIAYAGIHICLIL